LHAHSPTLDTAARRHLRAGALALLLVAPALAGGQLAGEPLLRLAGVGLFLALALAHDLRCQRVSNWITLPALLVAFAHAGWTGGGGGALEALVGAGAAFALLVLPYAAGTLGAGDVKAAMTLGAIYGAAGVSSLAVLAFALGAAFAALRFVARGGEAEGSASARGIPFVLALPLALALQQLL
jgi:Flp pilus assembly protein protease CpaA